MEESWLSPNDLLSLFSCIPQAHQPRGGPIPQRAGQGSLMSLIKKCPTGLPTGQSDGGIPSVRGSLFSDDSHLYQVDKTLGSILLSAGAGLPYRRKGMVVMDAIESAFAVLHQISLRYPQGARTGG